MSEPIFRAVQPVLPVRDVTKAIDYYTDKLGFELIFRHGETKIDYAGVRRVNVTPGFTRLHPGLNSGHLSEVGN